MASDMLEFLRDVQSAIGLTESVITNLQNGQAVEAQQVLS